MNKPSPDKKIKLSPTQIDIIQKMRDGWELGRNCGYRSSVWMQKNGIGRGGESKDLSISTFQILWEKKIITVIRIGYSTTVYALTDLGKTISL